MVVEEKKEEVKVVVEEKEEVKAEVEVEAEAEIRELQSDEEGELYDEEGVVVARQLNTLPNRCVGIVPQRDRCHKTSNHQFSVYDLF